MAETFPHKPSEAKAPIERKGFRVRHNTAKEITAVAPRKLFGISKLENKLLVFSLSISIAFTSQ